MGSITPFQAQEMLNRLNRNKRTPAPTDSPQAERETGKGGLHEQIMQFCNDQWPRWKYIRARSDKKSTIAPGINDFTIFAPGGRVFLIECKSKGGKPSTEQLAWAAELKALGQEVRFVWSFDEFLDFVHQP